MMKLWDHGRYVVGLSLKNTAVAVLLTVGMMPSQAYASTPATSAPPTSLPAVDPRILAKAKEWFHRFQTATIDRSQLNAQVNSQLTDTVVRKEAAVLQPFGQPSSFSFIRTYPIDDATSYDFMLRFKKGHIIELIAFDGDGKIAGIDFMTLAS